jgi:sulfite exporter TauE/SafE
MEATWEFLLQRRNTCYSLTSFASISLAFVLGFAGSLHCLGMCGPIALALPVHSKPLLKRVLAIWLYNSGRILIYSFLGIIAGLFGSGLLMMGFQRSLSLTLGILLFAGLLLNKAPAIRKIKSIQLFWSGVKLRMGQMLRRNGESSWLLLGMLNGILPCGMVYTAITAAIAGGEALNGALFMVVFGLGTLPAMFSVSFLNQVFRPFRKNLKYITQFVTALTAAILIARGLTNAPIEKQGENHHPVLCVKPSKVD